MAWMPLAGSLAARVLNNSGYGEVIPEMLA
jgi:hypothetical protein